MPEKKNNSYFIRLIFRKSRFSKEDVKEIFCRDFALVPQDPLSQLRDLVELKDQLEDIQRRVEDEIQAGVPPVRHLLTQFYPQPGRCLWKRVKCEVLRHTHAESKWMRLLLKLHLMNGIKKKKKNLRSIGSLEKKTSANSAPLCLSGRQFFGLSFPQGLPGGLRRGKAALLSADGRRGGNVYGNLRSANLQCS